MKILILRTFAHSLVWENTRNHCEFERSQLENMIYEWEPDYRDFRLDEFAYALGIYTYKYFTYRTFRTNEPVFLGSENEQIISYLKLDTNIINDNFIIAFTNHHSNSFDIHRR